MVLDTKIMVVDDAEINLNHIGCILTNNNYNIETYTNPNIALGKLFENPSNYGLVLIDYLYGDLGMTGLDFMQLVLNRHDLRSKPMILMTATDILRIQNDFYALGGVAVINKPIRENNLSHLVSRFYNTSINKLD